MVGLVVGFPSILLSCSSVHSTWIISTDELERSPEVPENVAQLAYCQAAGQGISRLTTGLMTPSPGAPMSIPPVFLQISKILSEKEDQGRFAVAVGEKNH